MQTQTEHPHGYGSCWGLCDSCGLTAWLIAYVGHSDRSCVPCYWKWWR